MQHQHLAGDHGTQGHPIEGGMDGVKDLRGWITAR